MGMYNDVEVSFATLLPVLLSITALVVGVLGHLFKGYEWDNTKENVWITLWETYRCSDSSRNCNFNTDISIAFTSITSTSLAALPADCNKLQAQYIATLVFAILACVASAIGFFWSMVVVVVQKVHPSVRFGGIVIMATGALLHALTFILYMTQQAYDCLSNAAANGTDVSQMPAPFMFLAGFFASMLVVMMYMK